MDRRQFMGLGGVAAAFSAASAAEAATLAVAGKSVIDFGVTPGASSDQSAAMQEAIDSLAAAGQPIIIPAGHYRVARLQLPSKSTVLGVPGLTVLIAQPGLSAFESLNAQDISLRGIAFAGTGLVARGCRNLSVCDCQVLSSAGDGIVCAGDGLFIAGNRASSCAKAAIWVEGDAMVTGNSVTGPGQFGLRLGGVERLGTLTVMNNMIKGTAIGIAASNSDNGYAFIAMNMISGAAKGGIRALMGDELIGKDLSHAGSEAFRNLEIAANVSV
ncbi:MAG: glycosyl hydrolase family 28-related protein [Rhodomicrobium sp.]